MKISIITINYNDKFGLTETINSVINQTYKNYEFIVIDGGSTDGSKEIIATFDSKIDIWVSEPDSGIYNAMNKGIKKANGDFVIFMNSGDTFYNDTILKNIESEIDIKYDLFYGDAYFINKKETFKVEYPDKLSFHFFTINSLCHQACFIKRTLFKDIFYYNENFKIISDWEFMIYSICNKNIKYKHISQIITNYNYEGISSLTETSNLIKKETKIVMDTYFPSFIDDYKNIAEIESKRIKKILKIKQFPIAWKLLKGFSNLLLVFLPKQK